jgi:1-acyl-sn-glycerol-3-phosphate acyltransferase
MIPASPSPTLRTLFETYTTHRLTRSFHTVYLYGPAPQIPGQDNVPLIVVCSHSGWWDVLLGLHVAGTVIRRDYYGVMDADQLRRYAFFRKLGMIGVDRGSLAEAREFIQYGANLLRGTSRALFLTPQGELASLRRRPVRFQPGLAHLVAAVGECHLLTLVFHQEFWQEPTPEAFISYSPVRRISAGADFSRRAFLRNEEQILEAQIDRLLLDAESRDPSRFRVGLKGGSGASSIYDFTRSLAARLRSQSVPLEHGAVTTPKWGDRHQDRVPDEETDP